MSLEPTFITDTADGDGGTAIEVRCWMLQGPDTVTYGVDSTSCTGVEGWTECEVALACKTDVPQSCSATIEVELNTTSSAPVRVEWTATASLNGTQSGCSQCSADPDNSEASVTLELVEQQPKSTPASAWACARSPASWAKLATDWTLGPGAILPIAGQEALVPDLRFSKGRRAPWLEVVGYWRPAQRHFRADRSRKAPPAPICARAG